MTPLLFAGLRALALGLLLAPLTAQAQQRPEPNYDDCCWRYVTGYVCPPYCGGGALGQNLMGHTMACEMWDYGTYDIEGVGRRTCTDRYAVGLSERFDVLVGSVAEAYAITGCHRFDVVQINYIIPPEPTYSRYHVQDHHCDAYVAHWGPNPS